MQRLDGSKKIIAYYTNQVRVEISGQVAWKNELDFNKTYSDKTVHKLMSKVYLYTRDNQSILSQVDDNQDGVIDKTIVLKDAHVIDEYRGPYKGSIQELN